MNRMNRFFTAAVMCATSISPIMTTAAMADTIPTPTANPGQEIVGDMQDQCNALAAAHDTFNGDIWTGEVVLGAVTLISGPTEVGGTRVVDESSIVGTGTFTPGTTYIQGEPFRIGGSVNMFGDQYASSGSWSDSTYNYTADFDSTFRHEFTCDIYQAVIHHGDPLAGYYEIRDDLIGTPQANAALQECTAYNTTGSSLPHPGYWGNSPQGNCQFVSQPTSDTWDPPLLTGNEAGTPIDLVQTDSLNAFEDHGGPVEADGGPFHIGQVVICISPNKPTPGGTWRNQNGYTGVNCTTDWFKNHAVWGSGTEGSNGTYISVPDYNL